VNGTHTQGRVDFPDKSATLNTIIAIPTPQKGQDARLMTYSDAIFIEIHIRKPWPGAAFLWHYSYKHSIDWEPQREGEGDRDSDTAAFASSRCRRQHLRSGMVGRGDGARPVVVVLWQLGIQPRLPD
jgi:hypothetical protein